MKPSPPRLRRVLGASSWRFASDKVEAYLTRDGGHLAPVTFATSRGKVQPYAIAPWSGERWDPRMPAVLKPLRGDFFCLPFGGNSAVWRGERHPVHGETAGRPWKLIGLTQLADGCELAAEMRPTVRKGQVRKILRLKNGETNVYCRHELNGFSGPMCLGHHAMLAFPAEEGAGALALSPWQEGRVFPEAFESPHLGGYSALKMGARFRDLRRVPLANGGTTDLSRYPAREGFEDLVMVSARGSSPLAWTTVAFPRQGYLWFGLKDPRTLASTVLWHSNGGRHYSPWTGRHRRVLGLEEVTSYFHFGLAPSVAADPLGRGRIPTVVRLRPDQTFAVNYVMGVAAIPRNFDRVREIQFGPKGIVFHATSGATVRHRLDLDFFSPR